MVELAAGGGTIGMSIDPAGFDGLTLQHDVAAAAWLEPFVWDRRRQGTVAFLMPPLFPAYARIDGWPDRADDERRLRDLLAILARHTATPGDACIGLWEGYGGLELPRGLPLVHLPPGGDMRRYMLLRGAVSAGASMMPHPSGHAPDLMWPADRAWLLATDTDIDHAFLGGTLACIDEVIAAGFGATRADLSDPFWP